MRLFVFHLRAALFWPSCVEWKACCLSRLLDEGLNRFLARLLLRSELSVAERDAILRLRGRVAEVPRGRELVLPERPVEQAILVIEGLIARFDEMNDGRRQITALHIAGDVSDLHSVPVPVPAWGIEAAANSTIALISHDDIRAAAVKFPALAFAFWRDTVVDASILAKWTANLGRADAATRLAHLLCEIGTRMEVAGVGGRDDFSLGLTQAQLADTLGLTTVHVNRTVMALKGLVGLSFAGGRVQVDNWPALAHIGAYDDGYLMLDKDAAAQEWASIS